jgi:hypothetical protein
MAIGKLRSAAAAACGLMTAAWMVHAQDRITTPVPESLAGTWRGAIDLAVDEIALTVRLQKLDDRWQGWVSIPERDVVDAPASNLVVGRSIAFDIAHSGQQFRGELQEDGTITCRVSRGRNSARCKLVRNAENSVAPKTRLTAEQVEGLPSNRGSIAETQHPAIGYATRPAADAVAQLNQQLDAGKLALQFNAENGYLASVLDALALPIDSQMIVFSKTSVQSRFIEPKTPRALYFDDKVSLGFIKNAPLIEIAAHDPRQGVIFYTLEQTLQQQPRFIRRDSCLSCHVSHNSMDVPGFLLRSVATGADGSALNALGNRYTDERTPYADRWGGWFVTGTVGADHLGNKAFTPEGVESRPLAPTAALPLSTLHPSYPGRFSDVVALLVFQHQTRMSNLLTRMNWDARAARDSIATDEQRALYRSLLTNNARELVDALLFVEEIPLPGTVVASSTFAKHFAAKGPLDNKGRSLRQFELSRRLFRYPCSYMVYSAAFDALPDDALQAVYARLWAVLSGSDADPRYGRLSANDKRSVVEILRATKPGLPDYFR